MSAELENTFSPEERIHFLGAFDSSCTSFLKIFHFRARQPLPTNQPHKPRLFSDLVSCYPFCVIVASYARPCTFSLPHGHVNASRLPQSSRKGGRS